MRMRFLAATGLVALALSATACSGGSGPAAATGSGAGSGSGGAGAAASPASDAAINVCSLISAQRASAIVGVHYSKATPGHDMCTYTPTNAPIGMYILIFTNSGGTAAWKEQLGILAEDGGGKPVAISGFSGGPAASDGVEVSAQAGSNIIDVNGGGPQRQREDLPEIAGHPEGGRGPAALTPPH